MTPVDPLSEAREALRSLMAACPLDATLAAEEALAHLDALPAPERIDTGIEQPCVGWFYPDAPSDGGDDA